MNQPISQPTAGSYAALFVALAAILLLYGALPGIASPAFLLAQWSAGFALSFADSFPPSLTATHFGAPQPAWIAFGLAGAYPVALLISAGLHPADAYSAMVAIWTTVAFLAAWQIARRAGVSPYLAVLSAVLWMSMLVIWRHAGYTMLAIGFSLLPFYFLPVIIIINLEYKEKIKLILTILFYFLSCLISVFMDGYSFMMFAVSSSIFLLIGFISERVRRTYFLYIVFPVHFLAFASAYVAYAAYIGVAEFDSHPIDWFRSYGADISFLLVPTKGVLWLWDGLGLSEYRHDGRFFSDGSVWDTSFILPIALLGICSWLFVRSKHWSATAALLTALVGIYLSLGPSFKFYSTRPPDVVGMAVPMAAELALGPTGTAWLSEHVPGFRTMRAAYRWVALAGFGFWLLVTLLFARCTRGWSRVAASLIGVLLIISNLPHPGQAWRDNVNHRRSFMALDRELAADMGHALKPGEMVTFLPYGNDFLVNYLAPAAGFRSHNIGGDKNLYHAREAWPSLLRESPAGRIDADITQRILLLLAQRQTDAVILPFFDQLIESWPTPLTKRDAVQPVLEQLETTGFVSIVNRHSYAVVRVAPAFSVALEQGKLEEQVRKSLPALSYQIGSAPLSFTSDNASGLRRLDGWHETEAGGTWTDGDAHLHLHLTPTPTGALVMSLDTYMMLGPEVPRRTLKIECNEQPCGEFDYTLGDAMQQLRIALPSGLIGSDGNLYLRFIVTPEATPKTAGVNADIRRLGIGLRELSITTSDQAP